MKVTVIGTGFVGVVTSAVMTKIGHSVIGLDLSQEKVALLNSGKAPFYEPQLEDFLFQGIQNERLRFSTSYDEGVKGADVILITVGTPSAKDGTANLAYVFEACRSAAPFIKNRTIIVIKSTVPPGTNQKVKEIFTKFTKNDFYVASVPEFLREGMAVADTLKPDRIVIGALEPWVIKKLIVLHEGLGGERVIVTPESAQMAKYTANAYLAQRITFINQIANLCEKNGAKISEVIKVIGYDKRIGSHYWYPGLGYGGSCFPKDVKELAAYARSIGEGQGLLPKIDELNEERLMRKLNEFEIKAGGFTNKKIAVLGLSFKPNTNDMRFAPSLVVVPYLMQRGAFVAVYDPKVKDEALAAFPGVVMGVNPYQTCDRAQVVLLLIEWKELIELDLSKLAGVMAENSVFIDTRNQYQETAVIEAGLRYIGIGNG